MSIGRIITRLGTLTGFLGGLAGLYTYLESRLGPPELQIYPNAAVIYAAPKSQACPSDFEVVAIPITIVNAGHATGIIERIGLTIQESGATKRQRSFYSSGTGDWQFDAKECVSGLQLFAPLAVNPGQSVSKTVVFYATYKEPLILTTPGEYQMVLSANEIRHGFWDGQPKPGSIRLEGFPVIVGQSIQSADQSKLTLVRPAP